MGNSVESRIGIYWLNAGQVIGVSCPLSQAEVGVPGLLDSSFTHIEVWPRVRAHAGLPMHLEYEDLPRGRVLYQVSSRRSIVYGDRAFLGNGGGVPERILRIRQAIATFFFLSVDNALWRHDDHYTFDQWRIDPLIDS